MLSARSKIRKTLAEALAYRHFVIKTKIFDDNQLINTYIKSMQTNQQGVSMFDIWGISKTQHEITIDFTNDEKIGTYAKKLLKKNDRIYNSKYEEYILSASQ